MSTPDATDNQPSTKSSGWQKASRWAMVVVGAILAIRGFTQAYHAFFPGLPSCTSDTTKTTIGKIFKEKNVELTSLTNQKTLTDGSSEKTCQADVATAAEAGTITYRIYWQDKSAQVQITKVDTHQR